MVTPGLDPGAQKPQRGVRKDSSKRESPRLTARAFSCQAPKKQNVIPALGAGTQSTSTLVAEINGVLTNAAPANVC